MKVNTPSFEYAPPPSKWVARLRRNIGIYKAFPLLFKVLGGMGSKFVAWAHCCAELENNSKRYPPLANSKLASEGDVGYTGDEEVNAFLSYKKSALENNFKSTESGDLYDEIVATISKILLKGDVKKVVNFGVCYAHIDAILAQRFPNVEFHAIDRSPYTKLLNEHEFGHLSNLKFFAGDGFELISNGSYKDGLLLHARTAVVLSKPLVAHLYDCAQVAGIKYIVGFEQFGLSHQTLQPYVFSTEDKDSLWWRGFMFIHNYPGLLFKAGYKIEEHSFLKTNHTDMDFQIFRFVAVQSAMN